MSRPTLSGWIGLAPVNVRGERLDRSPSLLDGWLTALGARLRPGGAECRRLRRFAEAVTTAAAGLAELDDAALTERCAGLRARLLRSGLHREALLIETFALVSEYATRSLGKRPYPVQLMAGRALLDGRMVEMATGEGKTLTAALPAITAALAGVPVHVVTVNGYLAERDAALIGPLYVAFGLSVGTVLPGQCPALHDAAYACDIVYCVNQELVFDYLRQHLDAGVRPFAGRGLPFAIVDEADSVLIDESRTPLVIARELPGETAADWLPAHEMAGQLDAEVHYRIEARERRVRLTGAGRRRLAETEHHGAWRLARVREERVEQALTARHLFVRDRDYVLRDGEVQIVDEFTGRVLPDRTWERGLHQLIELKEGCATSARRETLARLTYPRFFARYLRLAGMSGTLAEVAPELAMNYATALVRIPTHRPQQRCWLGARLYAQSGARWQAIVERACQLAAAGRAVLIGTRSVEASEQLAGLLAGRGIGAVVLNARQDADEAAIIAGAGAPGRITVATNMAGRGTDITLTAAVRAAGGLAVILSEFHESARIDRQLYGRAGRQGDPGSAEAHASLDDELFVRHGRPWLRELARRWPGGVLPRWLGTALLADAQRRAEAHNARIRIATGEQDRHWSQSLAFSGGEE